MKAVQVTYTVQPEYVETNKANIKKVMDSIKANPIDGMYYSSCLMEDGQTFVHTNIAKDDETMSRLNDVESFTAFRMALKASGPVSPPKQTKFDPVGASWEL